MGRIYHRLKCASKALLPASGSRPQVWQQLTNHGLIDYQLLAGLSDEAMYRTHSLHRAL